MTDAVDQARLRLQQAHEPLRDAIRRACLATCDVAEALADRDDADVEDRETNESVRKDVERGLLVEYAVVAVFDGGDVETYAPLVLGADGMAASYRVRGLLREGLRVMHD